MSQVNYYHYYVDIVVITVFLKTNYGGLPVAETDTAKGSSYNHFVFQKPVFKHLNITILTAVSKSPAVFLLVC